MLAKAIYKKPSLKGPFNFAPSNSLKNFNVGNIVNEFSKIYKKVNYIKTRRPFFEHSFISLNSSKSNKLLKWYPRYRTKEAIDKTVEWYKKTHKRKKYF